MSLDKSDVEKIAHLARMALDESHIEAYVEDLGNILNLVEQLEAADTDAIEPMFHPLHMAQRLRGDEVTESDCRGANQVVAPKVENGLYLVPKVIE
ncbi:MAG: aspartyl/glutamyl-tRNA(Asn/Gln) amidotransferase subunit C [gamma proteobacterium symbiont of Ctena orbiculata]|uniref:Aspartyl/glutamyl-tRNA(Asn/Gln) amidotransferase subunit C n=1 Tax=Candidatus Thiodiazotropha taylori TaxID=2792791 RepID=A0A944MAP3_9GAMM|nr:Asp-tRNA(Asn)/Glu-tRNA(Gln) amidotransferase subunit GatC [Candidatus Thiodiazotropha taylori]PUB89462.1 MAG: Asp-tRNA(Asn)/Glu-tRNA(Gln) amidotransferase GatCAB subunit C [gamma proteobacterium symbiont of Ctena orbiculata]MBT2987615.1 Asp-tRNA(Asn)/Glu-tRNA(Gln) amidotransferase subunit GatC [Candidatus Thiodiazotropha taylori]MBT2995130.1 Asp-tRNA(Asn)/Glu-tRNA(Gln) amidotransferase subunit GatC [Candidatus Thiodiazotropha taylori]MBT2999951.1 Asp-tRNA(Asn)/Glu-tRNA(Gln) amidotransferase 